jgi:hypothetical protein
MQSGDDDPKRGGDVVEGALPAATMPRKTRLAGALRDNLQRRKQQARLRAQPPVADDTREAAGDQHPAGETDTPL